jgi:HD-GYP domain-containing protein (c-di-GMP phosphodiesterase class II)
MNIRTIAFIAALSIMFAALHKQSPPLFSEDATIEYIYQEGLKNYFLSDYTAAISDFEKVHALNNSYRNNNTMLYRSLLRLGDIEYGKNNYPDARRLYARAVGVVGENDGLLWRLKTIDDINERVRIEKEKNKTETGRIIRISAYAILSLILIFSVLIFIIIRQRKKDRALTKLFSDIQMMIPSDLADKEHYNNIARINHLKDILCAILTDSHTSEQVEKQIADLKKEIYPRLVHYGETAPRAYNASSEIAIDTAYPQNGSHTTDVVKPVLTHDIIGVFLLLANIIDSRTRRPQHSIRVAENAFQIACFVKSREISPMTVKKIALIHDIGFLNTKGNIPASENDPSVHANGDAPEIIITHAERGARLVLLYGLPVEFSSGIQHHHERFDGNGYPNGLRGDKIPIVALVISAAEYLDGIRDDGKNPENLDHSEIETRFGGIAGRALIACIQKSKTE